MNGEIWDAAHLGTLTRHMKGFGWETYGKGRYKAHLGEGETIF